MPRHGFVTLLCESLWLVTDSTNYKVSAQPGFIASAPKLVELLMDVAMRRCRLSRLLPCCTSSHQERPSVVSPSASRLVSSSSTPSPGLNKHHDQLNIFLATHSKILVNLVASVWDRPILGVSERMELIIWTLAEIWRGQRCHSGSFPTFCVYFHSCTNQPPGLTDVDVIV
jgi:hypothetical protein